MTLEQMEVLTETRKPFVAERRTAANTAIVGTSQEDILFQRDSKELAANRCPRCGNGLDKEVTAEHIRFTCIAQPVWHHFVRSSSFQQFD
jgi:hypothetical protein